METENSLGKPRRKKGIVGSLVLIALLVSVIALSGFTVFSYVQRGSSTQASTATTTDSANVLNSLFNQMNVSLQIKVFNPDGSLASTHQYPNDIITNNLITIVGETLMGSGCVAMTTVNDIHQIQGACMDFMSVTSRTHMRADTSG